MNPDYQWGKQLMNDRQDSKKHAEKRKHPRIETYNEVDYILLDENKRKVREGKGRTVNLSQSGALLETGSPLDGMFIVLITFDLEGNKVRVKGRVAHSRESENPGFYLSGVRFAGSKQENIQAIVTFVKAYYRRKYEGRNGFL